MKQETLIIANKLACKLADLKEHRNKIWKCAIPEEQRAPEVETFLGRTFKITTVDSLREKDSPYDSILRKELMENSIEFFMYNYFQKLDAEIMRLEKEFAKL